MIRPVGSGENGLGPVVHLELSAKPFAHAGIAAAFVCVLAAVALLLRPVAPGPAPFAPAERGAAGAPLSFVPNRGQSPRSVLFEARGGRSRFAFERRGVVISIAPQTTLALRFLGANPSPVVEPGRRGAGHVNYLVGPRSRHRTGLPVYEGLVYRDLWPGIDMTFGRHGAKLRYELHIRPGGDPRDVRLAWRGAREVSVTETGALKVTTAAGAMVDAAPRTFQRVGGRRIPVSSRYVLGAGGRFGFEVGRYDRRRALVIDPELAYSTFLGGLGHDQANAVGVDGSGHAYVAGGTTSADFPTSEGAFDRSYGQNSSGAGDAFVTKLSRDGSDLVYSTFIGGSTGGDSAHAIAVDPGGHAYAAGSTSSLDFPTTPGAYQTTRPHNENPFAVKLSADGSRLEYGTYLGSGSAGAYAIAVDEAGIAYIAGDVCCTGAFPTTPGAYQPNNRGYNDAWVAKLDAAGSQVLQATMLGGDGFDFIGDMAIDDAGNAYVVGDSVSNVFPTTPGAFQQSRSVGSSDLFVSKLSSDLSRLEYSTWLGGSDTDNGFGIDVDHRGNAYVVGETDSRDFPTTPGSFDPSEPTGTGDGFVTKLNASGTALAYSTYLAGIEYFDRAEDVRVDGQGSAYVAGLTNSFDYTSDFPSTPDAFQPQKSGGSFVTDGFLTKLDPSGSRVLGSTFIGGDDEERVRGLAIDAAGAAYVVGETRSGNFPTSAGSYDRTLAVPNPPPTVCCVIDSFAAKILIRPGPPAALSLTPASAANPIGTDHCVTATVADAYGAPLGGIAVRFEVDGAVSAAGAEPSDSTGQARFCYQGPSLPGADRISAFADSDGDGVKADGEPGASADKSWVPPPSTDGCRVTGAGTIRAQNDDLASFGLHARAQSTSGASGRAAYVDRGPAEPFRLRSKSVDALVCEGRGATIFGSATVGGTTTAFRVDVEDRGQPGRRDTYRIVLGTGYDSGEQTLERGNIRAR